MKEKLLSKIDREEYTKMNLMSLNLTEPITYESKIIYSRNNIKSDFYNTQDLKGTVFYKKTSKLLKQ